MAHTNGPSTKPEWTTKVGGKPLIEEASKPAAPNTFGFPRLSRPVPLMRPEYDVVVIGSGYGGGVAASRMARAGKSVAVLELGTEKWPGEYPSNLTTAAPEVHVSGYLGTSTGLLKDMKVGNPTGLYHLILGEGQNAFVGNGLGGTSLLNANVFLECDDRTLGLSAWPKEIRDDPSALDQYYRAAADMLQPTPYPESYPTPKKLSVLQKQAKILGQEQNFYRPPQTTFFHNGRNNAGVEMKASTGSSQDCTGVNDGSKNSVLVTYIADAWNWGAEIFCECEVRYIHREPGQDGYTIFFSWHGNGRSEFEDEFQTQLMWVRAKELCFLGAGSLGTTEILLRSKAHGLQLSSMVGQKVSGNGDILSFGYNTDELVNGIGSEVPNHKDPCGPTITGVIDNRGPKTSPNVLDGHVIEEGAIPEALAKVIQPMLEILPGKEKPVPFTFDKRFRHFMSRMQTRLKGPYAIGSSLNRMQTYLIMSHDSNEGIVSLQNDRPHLQFLGVGRTKHVDVLRQELRKATNAIGGTLVNSPFYALKNQQEEITVHPLGGAIMSSDGTGRNGVTNHLGQLFIGDGDELHEGLLCVDGSVIPTALGVNPFATITALAERSVDRITRKHDLQIDQTKNNNLDLVGNPARSFPFTPDMSKASEIISNAKNATGIRFTEIMEGYIHIGYDIEDFTVAENIARGSASLGRLYLSVDAYDVETLIQRADHASLATGTFSCAALSKDPLLILRGEVQFFIDDETVSDGENLAYRLTLLSTDGQKYLLNGYKKLDSRMAFSVSHTWKATTTLYTTITELDGAVVGRGKLTISWRNFKSELKSFDTISGTKAGAGSRLSGLGAMQRFLTFFAGKTANFFFSPFRRLSYPDSSTDGYYNKQPPSSTITLTADDGVQTVMKVWSAQTDSKTDAEDKMPVLLIPGASVDDQIYSLPTIPVNAIEYFTSKGHVCYVPTPRFGMSPYATKGYTAYDARQDVAAAMRYVREAHKGRKFYVVCHCLGAIATSMALLDGSVPSEWIKGMTVSQAFFKLQFGAVNSLKLLAGPKVLPNLYQLLAGPWFPTSNSPDSSFIQSLIDQMLRLYPVGDRAEICDSIVCHRGSLAFGRLWTHDKLNRATHEHLGNFFGGLHMNFLSHLTTMGHGHNVCDNTFNSLVTDENLKRFRGLKILFISGGANVVFDPVTTSMNYDVLREKFGTGDYKRFVVDGYGHLDTWMGKRSFLDVYPEVLEHIVEVSG
ncbi:FAD/NAD(P)-binding domain-containing protein [Sporormia fimetaria CBS 119925]|uniref:Cholesterol oxidase n=1 Tax=Sporormia fimetaria CBS 119925 TaxID=1340428 RepID=A0A6A6UWI0_9PLEO|nr:FAD/NAD(P)-binding domain-containing protein [Sporormia fimetaria CBS 119925]